MKFFARFAFDIHGSTAIEYGLIAGLLATAIIGGFGLIGNNLETVLTTINASVATN